MSELLVFKVDTNRGWEFDEYFQSRTRGAYELSDECWILGVFGLRLLRQEAKCGDLFLSYEVDRKHVVGVARSVIAIIT